MLNYLEKTLINIAYVSLQTYFQIFWFYEHLAEKRCQKQWILFDFYPYINFTYSFIKIK